MIETKLSYEQAYNLVVESVNDRIAGLRKQIEELDERELEFEVKQALVNQYDYAMHELMLVQARLQNYRPGSVSLG